MAKIATFDAGSFWKNAYAHQRGKLLKRVNDWAASSPITIQSGSAFGIWDGHSIETADNSSTTAADIVINSGGRFYSGYQSANTAVAGGYVVPTPAVDGELAFDAQVGSKLYLSDFFVSCVKENKSW